MWPMWSALPAVNGQAPTAAQQGEQGALVALAGHEAVEDAARPQHARHLGHRGRRRRARAEQVEQHHHVETGVGIVQGQRVARRYSMGPPAARASASAALADVGAVQAQVGAVVREGVRLRRAPSRPPANRRARPAAPRGSVPAAARRGRACGAQQARPSMVRESRNRTRRTDRRANRAATRPGDGRRGRRAARGVISNQAAPASAIPHFDEGIARQRRHFHRGARGRRVAEELAVDLVHGREVAEVGEKTGGLHDLGQAGPAA